jgi:DNA-binding beta-propeller fold protein YncE
MHKLYTRSRTKNREPRTGRHLVLGSWFPVLVLVSLALLLRSGLAQAAPQVALVTTVAGSVGVGGSADGVGSAARYSDPSGVALSADAAFALVADTQNHTIRKLVPATGAVTTLAGTARANGSANGIGPATRFFHPEGVAISVDGTFALVADTDNHTIRKIVIATAEVTTLAGSPGSPGSANGTGDVARFSSPSSLALAAGFALVADTGNHTVRRIDITTGSVTTLAGSPGSAGAADGTGAAARFFSPRGVALSGDGALALVTDTGNHTLRTLAVATGVITTLAGSAGIPGSSDGSGEAARLRFPRGVALSADGSSALVADFSNNTIRAITIATRVVTTLAGTPGSSGSSDGAGTSARFAYPASIAMSGDGATVLVADPDNQTLRRISFVPVSPRVSLPLVLR